MFQYNLLLVTILLGHVEQQLLILSCSIDKYQEIGAVDLMVCLGSRFSVDISRYQ